jgi:low affinity Fe/Cu permease
LNSEQGPETLSRLLIAAGVVFILAGVLFSFARYLRLGSLPGDIHLSGRGWQVWIPLGTSILLSLVLTLILNLFFRRR